MLLYIYIVYGKAHDNLFMQSGSSHVKLIAYSIRELDVCRKLLRGPCLALESEMARARLRDLAPAHNARHSRSGVYGMN